MNLHKFTHYRGFSFKETRLVYETYNIASEFSEGASRSVAAIWNTIRNALENLATTGNGVYLDGGVGSNWQQMNRSVLSFDSSVINETDVLTAKVTMKVSIGNNDFSTNTVAVSATSASNTAYTTGDANIANFGGTKFSTVASTTSSADRDFVFNASGIAHVDVSGFTKIGLLIEFDYDDAEPSNPGSGTRSGYQYSGSGHLLIVTTPVVPTLTTSATSSITSTTATGNGNVTGDGGDPGGISEKGFLVSTLIDPEIGDAGVIRFIHATTALGAFTFAMTGLTPGTAYFVRPYAENQTGFGYGTSDSFTTTSVAPSVTTNQVSEIGESSATGNGVVDSDGGETITERGIVLNTSPNPDLTDTKFAVAGQEGAFTAELSGLLASTTYHVRAFATNSVGTTFGANISFVTVASQDNFVFNGFGLQNTIIVTTRILYDQMPNREVRARALPREDGELILGSNWRRKIVRLTGYILETTAALLDAKIDEMKEELSFEESVLDIKVQGVIRRYRATLINANNMFDREGWMLTFIPFTLEFLCHEAFAGTLGFSENEFLAETSLANNKTITNVGTAPAKPIITLTLTTLSGITKIGVTNNTTSQTITVQRTFTSSEVLVIDSDNKIVTVDGLEVDYDGVFPDLQQDDNSIDIDFTGTSATYDINIKNKDLFF